MDESLFYVARKLLESSNYEALAECVYVKPRIITVLCACCSLSLPHLSLKWKFMNENFPFVF